MKKNTKLKSKKIIGKQWFFYRFRLNLDINKKPIWWIDYFIIDRIFRYIVKTNIGVKIDLWRFHRRFLLDRAGHQVSLCVYIDEDKSDIISDYIIGTNCYITLMQNSILKEFLKEEGGFEISGSGDGSWSREISFSWPYYIQGASEAILEMIRLIGITSSFNVNFLNLLNIEEHYQTILTSF